MDRFSAPIPGESLTATPKSTAMERPPKYVDPDEAMNFIADKITQPRETAKFLATLKAGAPVEAIVNTMLFMGVSKGQFTPDMALTLKEPTLHYMIAHAERLKQDGHISKVKNMKEDSDLNMFLAKLHIDEPVEETPSILGITPKRKPQGEDIRASDDEQLNNTLDLMQEEDMPLEGTEEAIPEEIQNA